MTLTDKRESRAHPICHHLVNPSIEEPLGDQMMIKSVIKCPSVATNTKGRLDFREKKRTMRPINMRGRVDHL